MVQQLHNYTVPNRRFFLQVLAVRQDLEKLCVEHGIELTDDNEDNMRCRTAVLNVSGYIAMIDAPQATEGVEHFAIRVLSGYSDIRAIVDLIIKCLGIEECRFIGDDYW